MVSQSVIASTRPRTTWRVGFPTCYDGRTASDKKAVALHGDIRGKNVPNGWWPERGG